MEEQNLIPEPAIPDADIPAVQEPSAQLPEPETTVLKAPQKGKRKGWLVALLGLLLLAAGTCFYVFQVNQFSLEIQLAGEAEMLTPYGQPYQEPGAQVMLRGSRILKDGILPEDVQLEIASDVQDSVLGKYTVTYTARFHGWSASAVRSVRVADMECPVITLVSSEETILPGEKYEEPGFMATDNYDGDITHRVRRTEELGIITYAVMDSSGNPAYVEREIPYYDPLPPEITLTDGAHITIPCGTIYQEPGFAAMDNADGDVTNLVETEGEVLWYQPGTYEIIYRAPDSYGNQAETRRTVEVTALERPLEQYPDGRVIYLTFDDGPGPYTDELLYLLRYYNVKATFFVTDSGYDAMMKQIVDEGHSIGIHTRTHDYNTIYASEEAYFQDILGMQEIIWQNTGVRTTLLRFPGGGSNLVSRYNEGIMTRLAEAVQNAGFQYFDWNVDSNDAGGAITAKKVSENVIAGVQNHRVSIVLQHDIHPYSVNAVEDIIVWGLKNGYRFLPLQQNSPTMHHTVLN